MLTSYFKAIPADSKRRDHRRRNAPRRALPHNPAAIASGHRGDRIYAFVTTWNEFIFALVLAQTRA